MAEQAKKAEAEQAKKKLLLLVEHATEITGPIPAAARTKNEEFVNSRQTFEASFECSEEGCRKKRKAKDYKDPGIVNSTTLTCKDAGKKCADAEDDVVLPPKAYWPGSLVRVLLSDPDPEVSSWWPGIVEYSTDQHADYRRGSQQNDTLEFYVHFITRPPFPKYGGWYPLNRLIPWTKINLKTSGCTPEMKETIKHTVRHLENKHLYDRVSALSYIQEEIRRQKETAKARTAREGDAPEGAGPSKKLRK